jgi:uncharacterized membrane protein
MDFGGRGEHVKDYALSFVIFGTMIFCAIGGIDYVTGGKDPLFLKMAFVGILAIAVLAVVYIVRKLVLAVTSQSQRASRTQRPQA